MDDLQPLALLLEQAERLRDLALADHQRAQAAAQAAQTQAEQLLAYRRDYEQRWGEQFCREGKIELVRCYHGFVERLSQAVEQQRRVAEHAAQLALRAGNSLREHELRAASVRKLIARRVQELRVHADRREQKQSDEFAARAAWNRGEAEAPAHAHAV